MKNYSFTEEQTDLFLKGKADSDLSNQFHKAMEADPLFKKEIDFLGQSIEGIKSYRIKQLKSGLAQLPTPPLQPWYLQPAALWSAAGISGLGLIASVAIVFSENPSTNPTIAQSPTEIVRIVDEPKQSLNEEKPAPIQPIETKSKVSKKQKTDIKPERIEEKKEVKARRKNALPDDSEDLDPRFSGVDEANAALAPTYKEVILEKTSHYSFHYKLNEGVLTLYLKDQSAPYEVLDIKKGENQGLYLYYLGRYYGLKPTLDQVNTLKSISRKNLILELDKFRKGE